jgi:hypothetical protein
MTWLLCCLSKLNERTFVLNIKWLVFCVVWASWLNRLTFVLFEKDNWMDWLLCCLSKMIEVFEQNDLIDLTWLTVKDFLCCMLNDSTFVLFWANRLNGLDFCVVWLWRIWLFCNMTWLFVLYVKWLDFCVVWANWMNWLLCWTLNDSSFVLFEQVDWTDWLLCCTLNLIDLT